MALLIPCHGWVYADIPTHTEKLLKLDKAKAAHPNMQIIKHFEPTDHTNQDRILYKVPPDKTTYTMTINAKTGEIIQDHPYRNPQKTSLYDLGILKNELQQKYSIQKINKTTLKYSENRLIRTLYCTGKYKQKVTVVTDAFNGNIIRVEKD